MKEILLSLSVFICVHLWFHSIAFTKLRIDRVSQGFADEIVSEDGQKDRQPRKRGDPPLETGSAGAGLVQELAPAWFIDQAEAKETQRAFDQDRGRHAEAAVDQHRRDAVGKHMAKDDRAQW